MGPLPVDTCLREMFSAGRLREEDFTALKHCLRQERLLAPRTTQSCYQLTMQGNLTISYRMDPHQLAATYNVFNTAEILELILAFLLPLEQLQARGICRGIQAAIDSSAQIRRAMFRQSDPSRSPALVPYHVRGLTCTMIQARGKRSVSITMNEDACDSVQHSAFLRSVLLAQPSPTTALARRGCNCQAFAIFPLSRASGNLTFGDILPAVTSLGAECGKCKTFFGWQVNAPLE